jgi:hypothetical protein
MKQCNYCSNRKCDRLRLHRAKKRVLSLKELQSSCPYWKRIPRPGESLLIIALGSNPQGVQDCLSQFNFRIIDLKSYPFQRAAHKDGGKRGNRSNHKRAFRGKGHARKSKRAASGSGK